jgi:hypothetical protein
LSRTRNEKNKEQIRHEQSSAGFDLDRIPRLSFYPNSSDPTRQNPACGSSSQGQAQGQDNLGGSSSQVITRTMAALPLGPPATLDLKFSGQRF